MKLLLKPPCNKKVNCQLYKLTYSKLNVNKIITYELLFSQTEMQTFW